MARSVVEEGPHPVDRHVGRRVCEKRLSLGYNQTDLARALGLTFQQVQKYEKGANRISASKLWDIAGFFKVDVNYFFKGLDDADGAALNLVGQDDLPVTRPTLEITRLAPLLTSTQQRLALEMIREMTKTPVEA